MRAQSHQSRCDNLSWISRSRAANGHHLNRDNQCFDKRISNIFNQSRDRPEPKSGDFIKPRQLYKVIDPAILALGQEKCPPVFSGHANGTASTGPVGLLLTAMMISQARPNLHISVGGGDVSVAVPSSWPLPGAGAMSGTSHTALLLQQDEVARPLQQGSGLIQGFRHALNNIGGHAANLGAASLMKVKEHPFVFVGFTITATVATGASIGLGLFHGGTSAPLPPEQFIDELQHTMTSNGQSLLDKVEADIHACGNDDACIIARVKADLEALPEHALERLLASRMAPKVQNQNILPGAEASPLVAGPTLDGLVDQVIAAVRYLEKQHHEAPVQTTTQALTGLHKQYRESVKCDIVNRHGQVVGTESAMMHAHTDDEFGSALNIMEATAHANAMHTSNERAKGNTPKNRHGYKFEDQPFMVKESSCEFKVVDAENK